jgi:hypothetical protein
LPPLREPSLPIAGFDPAISAGRLEELLLHSCGEAERSRWTENGGITSLQSTVAFSSSITAKCRTYGTIVTYDAGLYDVDPHGAPGR